MPRSLAPRGQCPESIPVSVLPQGSPGRPGLCPFLWHGFLMRLRVRDPSAQRAVAVGQWGNVGWGCGGALQCPLWEGTARSWESGSDVGPPPSPCSRSPRSRKPTARRGGSWRFLKFWHRSPAPRGAADAGPRSLARFHGWLPTARPLERSSLCPASVLGSSWAPFPQLRHAHPVPPSQSVVELVGSSPRGAGCICSPREVWAK